MTLIDGKILNILTDIKSIQPVLFAELPLKNLLTKKKTRGATTFSENHELTC